MVTRREAVTSGTLGALGAVAVTSGTGEATSPSASGGGQSVEVTAQAMHALADQIAEMRVLIREVFGPTLTRGILVEIRRQFGVFLKSNQKYPDYCEVGPAVFTDLYDWHVRYQQPIEMSRVDNRTAIRFMFTWMILRPEQADSYVGIPFDRG